MRPPSGLLYPAAVALLLGTGLTARANLVHWTYNWSRNPVVVAAGSGGVTLTDEPLAHATGSSDIVATNLKVFSSADPTTPDAITNGNYTLKLALTDDASLATANLTFSGKLGGTFSKASAKVTNAFTGPTTASVTLGGILYTVTIGSYSPPGPPTASNSGSISATVIAGQSNPGTGTGGGTGGTGGGGTQNSPEPATVILAGLGLGFGGLVSWNKRRRARATAVETL